MDRNDLISRSALKEEVNKKNVVGRFNTLLLIDNAPTVTPDKIQAIMNDYLIYRCEPERPQGKWIPVSERWPAFSGLYLVSIDDLVTVAHFIGVCFMNKKGLMLNVSAWQELPEPYKKGGDNE